MSYQHSNLNTPFLKDFKLGLSNDGIFNHFINEFKEILDHHVPTKQTKFPGNTKHNLSKILKKGIMKRSRIKNKANNTGSKEDLKLYKIQCNIKKNFRKEKLERLLELL